MAKLTLKDPGANFRSTTQITDNNTLIEAALENTLSRDGTAPNQMEANLDMNSNRVLNLPAPTSDAEPYRKVDIDSGIGPDITTVADNVADVSTVATDISDVSTVADDLNGSDTIGAASSLVSAGSPGIPHIDSPGAVSLLTFGTGLSLAGGELSLDAELADISGITPSNGIFIVGDGSDFVGESGSTARISLGSGSIGDDIFQAADQAAFWTALGADYSSAVDGQVPTKQTGSIAFVTPAGAGDTLKAANETITGDWTYSGDLNLTSTSGTASRAMQDRLDDVINVKDYGATGDGVTDDSTAIQAALDAGNDIFFPDGDYLIGTKLTKSGSFWRILGAGNDRTVLIGDNGNNPILECDTVGTLITNIEVGHMQFRGNSDRTSGALLEFKKKLFNSSLPELGLRRYYDGIKFTGGAKIRLTGLLCDQQGRGSGTKGRYTLHLSGDATNEKVSDFHLTNANLSGLVDGADGLVAHLGVEACDGIYLNNSHFFYSDQAVLFTPTDATAGFDDVCASFFASNCYFDSSVTGEHIKWTGDATSYRNFRFSNCEFRDSGSTDGSCVIDANVDRVRFNSTCSWRTNDRSGIVTTAGHTVSGLFVGGEFQGNNTDANANAEDIRVLATGARISADFVDGGSAAANINLLSGTTSAKIVDCDFTRSNATTKVTDSGTDTLIKTNTGHSALCAFSATTAGSNLSLTTSAQQVLYSGEEYDLGGDFDPAAGEFTAPVDGLYEFKLSCQFINLTRAYVNTSDAGSATDPVIEQDRIDVQIRKDTGTGNAILRRRIVKTTSNEEGVTMFMQVQLDAGDIVNVAVVNINGARGDLRLADAGYHEFSGRLIERIY